MPLMSRTPEPVDAPRADPISRERREESAAHFFIACLLASLLPVVFYPQAPLSAPRHP